MVLQGFIIKLRAIEIQDMDYLNEMINNQGIQMATVKICFPVSKEKQIQWFQNRDEQIDLRYIIETKKKIAIGTIALMDIDWLNKTAFLSFKTLAKPTDRVEGDVFEACLLILHHAFQNLNLNCIIGQLLEYNWLSRKLTEKCGFKQEGVLKNRIFRRGKYQNQISYSLSWEDFLPIYLKYKKDIHCR